MRSFLGRECPRNSSFQNLHVWATFLLCFVKKQKIKLQHRKFGLFLACIKQYVLFFPFNLMVVWYMIMASGPITSWQIDGETMETVRDFVFEGSKITADGDCSHEIERGLFLGRKAMTHLDSIFKNRDITLPAKSHLVKAMVFPVVMYGCENWAIKKAEC